MAKLKPPALSRSIVADLLQARWETDLPDRVVDALRPFDGKPITTRMLPAIDKATRDRWRMVRHYGWTEIQNESYVKDQTADSDDCCRLILARSESSVPLDLSQIEDLNTAGFAGRRERNAARLIGRNDAAKLDELVLCGNAIAVCLSHLREFKIEWDRLTGYGEAYNPEKYDLEKLIGIYRVDLEEDQS